MLWDQINTPDFATMLYSFESKEQTKIKNTMYMIQCKYNAQRFR